LSSGAEVPAGPAAEIAGRRLANHHITGERLANPEAVVRWMGALQAQDYNQAVWAIGARTQAATLVDVERAIESGAILRTWPMRGTIHFVPAEDARWMLELSASRMIARDARRQRQLELDEAILIRSKELLANALAGGKLMTRAALMQVLDDAGISTRQQRGYHILWYAAQTGLICLGPMAAKQQTFALLAEWAPRLRELTRDEALAELANWYFRARGPATLADFAWWSGLTMADVRRGVQAAGGIRSERIIGQEYWASAEAGPDRPRGGLGVQLLAGFDEYLLGYRDRSAVLAPAVANRVVPGENGVFFPMIVIDGQVVGTWKRQIKKGAVAITLTPFTDLGGLEDELDQAARRYATFLGLSPTNVDVLANID
jgi:hypothetical protein